MILLRQSTSTTRRLGPFIDDTDGKTAETSLTIGQSDIRLSKAGGDFAQPNDSGGATHDEAGWYYLTLDATDTNTVGSLEVQIHVSGALPVWKEFMVIPANVYDSLVAGTDYLDVEVAALIAAVANKIADHIIRRSLASAEASSDGDTYAFRSMAGMISTFVNKIAPNGTDLEVFKTDDSTVLGSRAMTTNSNADPITALDTN